MNTKSFDIQSINAIKKQKLFDVDAGEIIPFKQIKHQRNIIQNSEANWIYLTKRHFNNTQKKWFGIKFLLGKYFSVCKRRENEWVREEKNTFRLNSSGLQGLVVMKTLIMNYKINNCICLLIVITLLRQ